jgi:hypothetical protein
MAAVPQAVRERNQRDEAALREQGIDPNGPPPAFTAPPVSQAPVAAPPLAPAPIDDAATLRAENERLKQELSTQGGRVSATATEVEELKQRFDLINQNRAFLESTVTTISEKNQQLERELAEARASGTKSQVEEVVTKLDDAGPTKEQIEQFGADSQNFVERIVQQRMAAALRPLAAQMKHMEGLLGRVKDIDAKIPQLEKSAKVADFNTARQREDQFLRSEILPHFPNFESVRQTPKWQDYLKRDTGRGYRLGNLLQVYREQNNADGIRAILGAFYDAEAKPTLDSLAVPAKSAADAPLTPAVPKMKASEYKANLRAMTSKTMSKQDWDAYRARWEQALQAGNVDMDTELR